MKHLYLWLLIATTSALFSSVSAKPNPAIAIAAWGDSYTIGTGISPDKSWPYQLGNQLQQLSFSTEVSIVARNGWTSARLLQAVKQQRCNTPYDWVFILIGVNDQYQGLSIKQFRNNLDRLIHEAERCGNNISLVAIPDWSQSPFGERHREAGTVSAEITAFNEVVINTAEARKLAFVDIRESNQMLAQSPLSQFAKDGLHFSAKTYQQWAAQIIKETHFSPSP